MLVYYIVDLAYQLHFLFCILQVTTNLQSSAAYQLHFYFAFACGNHATCNPLYSLQGSLYLICLDPAVSRENF